MGGEGSLLVRSLKAGDRGKRGVVFSINSGESESARSEYFTKTHEDFGGN